MKFPPKIPAVVSATYARTLLIVLLNLPLVWGCLLWDLRGVDATALTAAYTAAVLAGWYVLPLLVVLGAAFLLLLPVRRAAAPATALIAAVYVYYLLLDAVAYGVIRIHIDFFWLEYLVRDFAGLGLPDSSVVTAAVALALILLVEFGILRLSGRLRPPRRLAPAVWAAAVLAMTASQILHIVAYQRNDSRVTVLTPHLPFYVPFTSHRNADKYGDLLPFAMDEDAAVLEESTASLTYPLAPLTFDPAAAPSPPNLVVILLESWRFDAMDADVTPNIHRLSLESSVFTQNLSTGNQTTAGIFGIFYGLHPTYWAAVKANSARIDNPVLVDALTERGYACALYARSKFGRHKIQGHDVPRHRAARGLRGQERPGDGRRPDRGLPRLPARAGGPRRPVLRPRLLQVLALRLLLPARVRDRQAGQEHQHGVHERRHRPGALPERLPQRGALHRHDGRPGPGRVAGPGPARQDHRHRDDRPRRGLQRRPGPTSGATAPTTRSTRCRCP
jgi:hypothetical protein